MLLKKLFLLSMIAGVTAAVGLPGCAAETGDEEDEDYEEEPQVDTSEEALRSGVSCAEKAATGYNRGSAYAMKVVTVGGKSTAKPTAHAFLKLQAAADRAGVSLSINSGFRTMAEQQRLYDCYRTKRCNNGNLAARPGFSNHQNGRALDLATSNWGWVRSNAPKFGFRATVPSERWHWEFSGADPGGPCSGGSTAPAASPDGADDAEPTGGGCRSATLGKDVAEGACVQAESNEAYYQCHEGKWYRGVTNGKGPYGTCTSSHAL